MARHAQAAERPGAKGPWTVATALRTGAFWGLFAAYLFTSMAAYSVLPHSVAYLIERGFDPLMAASAFGLTGMLSVIGILAVGWLSDRFGHLRTASLSYLSTIIGIAALILVSAWPSLALVYAFVWFFGLMQGARGPIIIVLVARLFPGGGVGAIYGTLSLAMGLGAGLGSWAAGLLYELTGSYLASFTLAIGGALMGLAMFWSIRPLREGGIAPKRAGLLIAAQWAKNTGSSAADRIWLVAPPKIICRNRLCV